MPLIINKKSGYRINSVSLKNFKCFRQTEIGMSRITLLTGENSSGKSSLLYGLLVPFQSEGFPLYLSPNGQYVNMGDFREMSFNHLKENKIEINISVTDDFDRERKYHTVWGIDSMNRMPKLTYMKCLGEFFDFEISMSGNNYIATCNIDRKSRNFAHVTNQKKEILYPRYKDVKNLKLESLNEIYNMMGNEDVPLLLMNVYYDRVLNFIGPFRLEPERTYYQKSKAGEKVGRAGEGYIDQILEWEIQESDEIKKLRMILKKLGLLNTLKIRTLPGGRFELSVKVRRKGNWAALSDVGFGISQFLPVIVADLQLSDDSILVLAQPEIHLHPNAQAALADYFVRQVAKTQKQYIIETHSEYLLNRIRLAIVKGEIDPSWVSLYYFENSIDGSMTYPIELTTDGQIRNAPQGFFDTYMMDTMNIALYA
jgi:predicted ATPase